MSDIPNYVRYRLVCLLICVYEEKWQQWHSLFAWRMYMRLYIIEYSKSCSRLSIFNFFLCLIFCLWFFLLASVDFLTVYCFPSSFLNVSPSPSERICDISDGILVPINYWDKKHIQFAQIYCWKCVGNIV